MSTGFIEAAVCPTIPVKYLAQVETWLLRRLFITEERDNQLAFFGSWSLDFFPHGKTVLHDEELGKALAASRQVCPELCAAVEREITKNGKINLASVDYETIFQGIVRRHPDFGHISIDERCFYSGYLEYEQTLTLITATEIGSICTGGGKIIHRSKPWEPDPCYIMSNEEECLDKASMKSFVAEDRFSEPPF